MMIEEPPTVTESYHAAQRRVAMDEEIDIKFQCFEVVDRADANKHEIGEEIVGIQSQVLQRFKARYVEKGFSQSLHISHVDYNEIFCVWYTSLNQWKERATDYS
mmetsp:Transcript_10382/g.13563  ORF Transcript_10382/g.13563 Transcript_10382/m.13563 type:complete len:104 (+) Transcript_10382:3260-3571(+)